MTKKPVIHHPGKILREEFLLPTQISPIKLARDINVSSKEIKEIINEQRDLTKDVATRLALYFHTAPTFWVNLQSNYDEEQVTKFLFKNLKKEVHPFTA